ncbi:hypothetical protein B2J93_1964 [Marssonina coronariae]|uniref:Uncharacterized protein n=1 Tax=Diplocarpon coronariae TaxID=2795749 RepID=A0A218ZGI4_9HELO|nr:hypothetical protein B2J93_1964 [Marssonina coronariae]
MTPPPADTSDSFAGLPARQLHRRAASGISQAGSPLRSDKGWKSDNLTYGIRRAIPTVADPSPKGLGGPDQNTPGIAQEIFHGPAFERGSVQLSKGRGIVSSSCIPPSVCASREEPASRCMRDHSGDSAATETFRAHVWRILEERPRRRQAKKSSQVGVHISMRSGVQQVALIEPRTFGPGKITMSRQQAEGIGSCWLSRRRRNVVYRSASWKLLPGNSHQKKQEDQAAHLRIPSPTPPPLVDMGPQGTSLPWTEDKKISLKRKETSVEPNAACRRTVFRPSRPSPAGSIVATTVPRSPEARMIPRSFERAAFTSPSLARVGRVYQRRGDGFVVGMHPFRRGNASYHGLSSWLSVPAAVQRRSLVTWTGAGIFSPDLTLSSGKPSVYRPCPAARTCSTPALRGVSHAAHRSTVSPSDPVWIRDADITFNLYSARCGAILIPRLNPPRPPGSRKGSGSPATQALHVAEPTGDFDDLPQDARFEWVACMGVAITRTWT